MSKNKNCTICGKSFLELDHTGRPRHLCYSDDCRKRYKAQHKRNARFKKIMIKEYKDAIRKKSQQKLAEKKNKSKTSGVGSEK